MMQKNAEVLYFQAQQGFIDWLPENIHYNKQYWMKLTAPKQMAAGITRTNSLQPAEPILQNKLPKKIPYKQCKKLQN